MTAKSFDLAALGLAGCGAWKEGGVEMATTYSYNAFWHDTEQGCVTERYTDFDDKPAEGVRWDIQIFLATRHPRFFGARPEDIDVQLARFS